MFLPSDRIRHQLNLRRKEPETDARNEQIADLLAEALIEARRTGEATEQVMTARFGFTRDELLHYGTAAKDMATDRWARLNAVEA